MVTPLTILLSAFLSSPALATTPPASCSQTASPQVCAANRREVDEWMKDPSLIPPLATLNKIHSDYLTPREKTYFNALTIEAKIAEANGAAIA